MNQLNLDTSTELDCQRKEKKKEEYMIVVLMRMRCYRSSRRWGKVEDVYRGQMIRRKEDSKIY